MKKFLALALVAVMMMAVCGVAFAEDPAYSITVTNTNDHVSIDGKTYYAFKVFDLTLGAATTTGSGDEAVTTYGAYSYSISKGSWAWITLTSGATTTTDGVITTTYGLDLTPSASDPTTYVVSNPSNAFGDDDARSLADALQAVLPDIADADGSAQASGQSAKINLTSAGYYVVYGTAEPTADIEANGELVAALGLTSTDPTVTVNPKVDAPQLDKKITGEHVLDDDGKAATAQVGTTVSFELDSSVPDLTGYSDYKYIIHDTMSDGLSFIGTDTENAINGLAVSINGTELTEGYSVSHAVNSKSFTVTIPFNTLKNYTKGAPIVVTYSAIVNEKALTTDYENNTAHLEYSRNPYDDNTNETPDSKVYVIDVNIDVDKVAEVTGGNSLSGAKFVLFKGTTQPADTATAWYHWNSETKAVEWVTKANADVYTTDTTGKLDHQFQGLEAEKTGTTYGLLETQAPTGYNLLDAPIYVTLTGGLSGATATLSSSATATLDKETINLAQAPAAQPVATAEIINKSGTVLPSTGGIGTTIFYVAGLVLVLGAAVILVVRRKAEQE